jgi:hypothetical protein
MLFTFDATSVSKEAFVVQFAMRFSELKSRSAPPAFQMLFDCEE